MANHFPLKHFSTHILKLLGHSGLNELVRFQDFIFSSDVIRPQNLDFTAVVPHQAVYGTVRLYQVHSFSWKKRAWVLSSLLVTSTCSWPWELSAWAVTFIRTILVCQGSSLVVSLKCRRTLALRYVLQGTLLAGWLVWIPNGKCFRFEIPQHAVFSQERNSWDEIIQQATVNHNQVLYHQLDI